MISYPSLLRLSLATKAPLLKIVAFVHGSKVGHEIGLTLFFEAFFYKVETMNNQRGKSKLHVPLRQKLAGTLLSPPGNKQ